eukprot:2112382-Rhodomonas_salina.1
MAGSLSSFLSLLAPPLKLPAPSLTFHSSLLPQASLSASSSGRPPRTTGNGHKISFHMIFHALDLAARSHPQAQCRPNLGL